MAARCNNHAYTISPMRTLHPTVQRASGRSRHDAHGPLMTRGCHHTRAQSAGDSVQIHTRQVGSQNASSMTYVACKSAVEPKRPTSLFGVRTLGGLFESLRSRPGAIEVVGSPRPTRSRPESAFKPTRSAHLASSVEVEMKHRLFDSRILPVRVCRR